MSEANYLKCHCGDDIADFFKDEIRRNVCQSLIVHLEYQGKKYCVLHFPNKAKKESFEEVLNERLKRQNYNFEGVWFPDNLDLSNKEF